MPITPEPATAPRRAVEDPDRDGVVRGDSATVEPRAGTRDLVVEDLLVEDVSIDGMCGVY